MSDHDSDVPDLQETPGAGDSGGSSVLRADVTDVADSDLSDRMAELSDAGQPMPRPPGEPVAVPGAKVPKWQGKRVGRFRIVSLLGRGSWGRVFEAEDTTLRRRIALKLLSTTTRGGMPASDFSRVATEARAAAALEHPNVIQIYEVGEKGDFFFLAMELAEGGSVEETMNATGPIDPIRACTLCAEAGDALSLAHECGIIHRDVKPANLLLSRAGRCKVCDFGLASGGDVSDPLHATRAAGTAHYVAPEIVKGQEPNARSDIYSLGVTLYHMLSGKRPFEGTKGRKEVLKAQVNREPPPLARLAPHLDPKLVTLVERAMHKDPAERFADMRSISRGLRLFTVPVNASSSAVVMPDMAALAAPPAAPQSTPVVPKERASWMPWAIGLACAIGVAALVYAVLNRAENGSTDGPIVGGPAVVPPAVTNDNNPRPAQPPALDTRPAGEAGVANVTGVAVSQEFTLDANRLPASPETVAIAGDFNGWAETADPLTDPDGDGIWTARVDLSPGLHQYKFVLDFGLPTQQWRTDPSADPSLESNDNYGGRNSGVMVQPPAADDE